MSDTLIPNERPKIIDEIWATLDRTTKGLEEVKLIMKASAEENRLRQAEAAEESKRRQAEAAEESKLRQAEHEKRMAEWQAEAAEESKRRQAEYEKWKKDFEKEAKKTKKQLGRLGNSIGGVLEMLVAARLWEKFSAYPYGFKRAHKRVMVHKGDTGWELAEIDILLSNTEWVMAVEVKRNVKQSDVTHHVKRLQLIRDNPPAEAKGKKLLGAVAGGTVGPEVRDLAFECGFFVLELKGEAVELLPPPAGFTPTELTCGKS
ncbi:MAG: hypothetical protein FWG66_14510 [Spirochaetes bacterium]|nr:hypothetical protein [Spirochaetota bacterium]